VINRRAMHVRLAELAALIYPYSIGFGLLVGVFIVLLPAISHDWKVLILQCSVTMALYEEFALFGSLAIFILLILFFATIISSSYSRSLSKNWSSEREYGLPSIRQIVERKIYPDDLRGEFCFYSLIIINFLGFFVWIYLPFGWISFLLRAGS